MGCPNWDGCTTKEVLPPGLCFGLRAIEVGLVVTIASQKKKKKKKKRSQSRKSPEF
jgi:hypothetical protein